MAEDLMADVNEAGTGRTWFPLDAPCAVDPTQFDCGLCDIGMLRHCRLRSDSTRRWILAARYRRLNGWLEVTPDDVTEIVRRTIEYARVFGGPTPIGAIGTVPRHVEAAWARDSRISPTRTGYGRVVGDASSSRSSPVEADYAPALLYIREAYAAARQNAGENLPRLVELFAIRQMLEEDEPGEGALEEPSSSSVSQLCEAEGWTRSDVVRAAYGHSLAAPPKSADHHSLRVTVLTRVRAEPLGSMRRHELVSRADELRASLTQANLPLAIDQVYQQRSGRWRFDTYASVDALDLLQEAAIGLMLGVDKYDPFMGANFATYAVYWIRQRVARWVRDHRHTVRVPVHVQDRLAPLIGSWDSSDDDFKDSLSVESIASVLHELHPGVASGDIALAAQIIGVSQTLSTDRIPMRNRSDRDDGPGRLIAARETHCWTERVEDAVELNDLRDDIAKMLGQLPARERSVLVRRAGLSRDGQASLLEGGETLATIGDSMGLTRERIRQIERRAIRRIRMSDRTSWFRAKWQDR